MRRWRLYDNTQIPWSAGPGLFADWARYLLIGLYVLSILLANLTLNRFIALPLYGQLSVGTIFLPPCSHCATVSTVTA